MAECDTCIRGSDCDGREKYEQIKKHWGEGVRCSGYIDKNTPDGYQAKVSFFDEFPTTYTEEVKTGQWVTKYNENGYHKECSVCGARWMLDSVKHICVETPRCYNCGARLRKEENDAT
jgi:hypothetical protein